MFAFYNFSLITILFVSFLFFSLFGLSSIFFSRSIIYNNKKQSDEDRSLVNMFSEATSAIVCIFLGFLTMSVWSSYNSIGLIIENEVSSIVSFYRDCNFIKNKEYAVRLRKSIVDYVNCVIEKEWPLMKKHFRAHEINKIFLEMSVVLNVLNSETLIDKFNKIVVQRSLRLQSGYSKVSAVMWIISIFGVLALIFVPTLMIALRLDIHILLTMIIAAISSFIITLLIYVDNPFANFGFLPNGLIYFLTILNELIL